MAFGEVKGLEKVHETISRSIIRSMILNNYETWDVNKKQEMKLQALELDAMKRSCTVSRLQNIPKASRKEKMNMKDVIDEYKKG